MNSLIPMTPGDFEACVQGAEHVIQIIPGAKTAIHEAVLATLIDPIRRFRREKNLEHQLKLAHMELEADQKLEQIKECSSKDASRIFEASADEDREELQALWATLIAKMLTGELRTIRAEWLNIIRDIEPIDALVLLNLKHFRAKLDSREEAILVAFRALRRIERCESITNTEVDLSLLELEKTGLIMLKRSRHSPRLGMTSEQLCFSYTSLGQHILDLVSKGEAKTPQEPASP